MALAMPVLIVNMGGEMVYILEQRLEAQNVPKEKGLRGARRRDDAHRSRARVRAHAHGRRGTHPRSLAHGAQCSPT